MRNSWGSAWPANATGIEQVQAIIYIKSIAVTALWEPPPCAFGVLANKLHMQRSLFSNQVVAKHVVAVHNTGNNFSQAQTAGASQMATSEVGVLRALQFLACTERAFDIVIQGYVKVPMQGGPDIWQTSGYQQGPVFNGSLGIASEAAYPVMDPTKLAPAFKPTVADPMAAIVAGVAY